MRINEYEEFLNRPDPWICDRCGAEVPYKWMTDGSPMTGLAGYWCKMACPNHETGLKVAWTVVGIIALFFLITLVYTLTHLS